MLTIADEVLPETAEVARAKLRIDTRKWVLARMNPKKYSDKGQDDNTDNAISLMAKFMKELGKIRGIMFDKLADPLYRLNNLYYITDKTGKKLNSR